MKQNNLKNISTDDYIIGLFYGGFVLIGMSVGSFVGFMIGGGREDFLTTGWVETMIGTVTGLALGVGLGLLAHAVFVLHSRKSIYKL
jgi:hypothetical protein